MSERPDSVGRVESLANQFKHREISLKQSLKVLAGHLVTACEGANIYASGKDCTVEHTSPDDGIYGHFTFNGYSIQIAYRSSDDYEEGPYGPGFDLKSIEAAPAEWLHRLIAGKSMDHLLAEITEQLQQQVRDLEESTQAVDHLADNPWLALASSFEQAAQKLGYSRALTDWKEAQLAIHSNPEAAITRACSLLETACKHVIQDLGADLPADQSIQSLFKAACNALDLDPAEQANAELKGLCGGLRTVAQSIGALRTRFGDAHGKAPEFVSLTPSHARLAVNSAGAAATFLMERWSTTKENAHLPD